MAFCCPKFQLRFWYVVPAVFEHFRFLATDMIRHVATCLIGQCGPQIVQVVVSPIDFRSSTFCTWNTSKRFKIFQF